MISIEPSTSPNPIRSAAFSAILTPLLACFVIVAATGGVASAASPEQPGETKEARPQVSVEQPVANLGTVVKGDRVEHEFVLRNEGDTPLRIERLATYVELAVLEYDETIAPGGEGAVRVVLDSTKVTGPGKSILGVHAEGFEEPVAIMTLEFNVVSRLLAHPGYARWIYVQHEREGTISQTVYSADGADFEIVRVDAPMPAIQVSFREATGEERIEDFEGSQWIVEATLESTAPVGAIEGTLAIDTTHPRQQTMHIPVSGFVRPTLFVSPRENHLGTIERDRQKRVVYTVRNFATNPIRLTGVETDIPGVAARIEPVEEGRRYRIVVELAPSKMEAGPFSGTIAVTTDSEKVPSLDIDLHGTLVEPASADSSSR